MDTDFKNKNHKERNMETGLTYTSTVIVSKENIAATMGSGDLEVFSIPATTEYTHKASYKTDVSSVLAHPLI